eukprot:gene12000-13620_t
MGCDFKVLIQVLYGSHWLTILDFGTKTRCGGFPMCPATEELFKRKKILANHGTQFKTISSKMDAASLILKGLVIEDVNRRETERERGWREYKEYQASEGRVVEDDLVPDENEAFLFYTVEEFKELIKCIAAEEKLVPEYADLLYTRLLTPVPMWCQMARSALPVNIEQIWMSEDQEEIDDVTNRLVAKQKQLRALHRGEIVKTFSNLPDELARLIAEFSGPVAMDVRVAFKDDEGQSCELIKATRKCIQVAMEKKEATQQQLREHLKQSTAGREERLPNLDEALSEMLLVMSQWQQHASPTQCAFCEECPANAPSVALRRCTKCKKVAYCSVGCQKAHWKVHKKSCK